MKLFDKVRAKRNLAACFGETVEKDFVGYIVDEYTIPRKAYCVEFCEFDGELYESILADCTEEDLELVDEGYDIDAILNGKKK